MPPESYIKVPLPLSLVLSLPFVSPPALARAQPLPEAILHFWMAKAGKKESQLWVVKRRKAEQIQSELLYRLCCKCTPSTWWSGYLGKAVRILVFCKQMKGLASGDVMRLPPWKPRLVTQGFPQDVGNKYLGWSVAVQGAGHQCRGCGHHQHHCCFQYLTKTTLVNGCNKDRRKKGYWEVFFISEHMQKTVCGLHRWKQFFCWSLKYLLS